MHAELASLNNCAVPLALLIRAGANMYWYHYTYSFILFQIEVKKGQFSPPKITLSEFLSDMHSEKLL